MMREESGSVVLAKLAPPSAVVGAQLMGVSLETWVNALTLVYLGLIIVHHVVSKYIAPRWKKYGRRSTDR